MPRIEEIDDDEVISTDTKAEAASVSYKVEEPDQETAEKPKPKRSSESQRPSQRQSRRSAFRDPFHGALSSMFSGFGEGLSGFFDFPDFSFSDDDESDGSGMHNIVEESTEQVFHNGVMEQTETHRDSRNGLERVRVTRRVGNKEKTIEQKRVKDGKITTTEKSKGLQDGEDFEQLWNAKAKVTDGKKQEKPLTIEGKKEGKAKKCSKQNTTTKSKKNAKRASSTAKKTTAIPSTSTKKN